MTPEGRVKALVNKGLDDLIKQGIVWKFMPVQMGMGMPALDYLLCCNGRFLSVETKVKGKHLTPRQVGTKAAIERAGGKVFVVDDAQSCATAMTVIRGFAGWGMADGAGVDPYTQTNNWLPPAED